MGRPRSIVRGGDGRVSVVLAVGQAMLLAGLGLVISAEPDLMVVAEASDGLQVLRLAAELRPLVVVVARSLPGLNGLEVARRLAEDRGHRCSFSRARCRTTAWVPSRRIGRLGVVATSGRRGCWARRSVRWLTAAWLDPRVARQAVADLARRDVPAAHAGVLVEQLTPREREVLTLLAHGLSNPAIARRLVISESTVKTHVGRILGKLNVHERFQAVAAAYRSGLVSPSKPLDARPGP